RAGVAGAPGAGATQPRLAGVAAWSLAHGFASLLLSDNLDDALEGRAPEDAFREVAGLLFGREGGRTEEP
ncbi:TetR family transcriptional regulator, partial [Streptomyces sp. ZG43]